MPCALVQRHKESSLHTRPAIRWHPFAFVVAFMLLVALGWQGKRTQEAVLQTNQAVSQSLETITAIQAIRSALQDIETGTRGFVLTADEAYLDAYASGLIDWKPTGASCRSSPTRAATRSSAGSSSSTPPPPSA